MEIKKSCLVKKCEIRHHLYSYVINGCTDTPGWLRLPTGCCQSQGLLFFSALIVLRYASISLKLSIRVTVVGHVPILCVDQAVNQVAKSPFALRLAKCGGS